MTRRPIALLVGGLVFGVIVAGCVDSIPEYSQQAATQPRPATAADPPLESNADEAMAALSSWLDGLDQVVFDMAVDIQSDDPPVVIRARVHRDPIAQRDWIDLAVFEAGGSSDPFQAMVENETVHVSLSGSVWVPIDDPDINWLLDLTTLNLDALMNIEAIAGLLECLSTPIGSLSESNGEGRQVWDVHCEGMTSEAAERDAAEDLTMAMLELLAPLMEAAPDGAEPARDETTAPDGQRSSYVSAYLRIIVERDSGALLLLEWRFASREGDQPVFGQHHSASLESYNELIEFPDVTEAPLQ